MNRRKFVSLLSSGMASWKATSKLSAAAMVSLPEAMSADGPRAPQSPNVIVMICDDLGYGDLGCYGSKLPTPNLDAMARDGAQFQHWNSGHPICSASRAALLTGRYGLRMNTYGAFGPNAQAGTSLDETLLSNLFHDRGYATKAIGKWHLGHQPAYLPTHRGFNSYLGVPWSDDMAPLPMIRDDQVIEPNTERELLTVRYCEEAVQFLEQPKRQHAPFFLYLAFSYPHDPARPSARFRGKTSFGHVGDAIAEIDWSVGEVMRTLEKQGLTQNTLLLFTSDHGPWYQGSPGALRGRKASTFEGGFRVPMLMKWPGRVPAGRKVDAWCSHLDVLPSLVTLCDLKAPSKPLDGADMSSVWCGQRERVARGPLLYFSAQGNSGLDVHCIRRDEWKLRLAQGTKGEIYLNDSTTGARSSSWLIHPELYNLEQDPAESYDVAHLHPDLVAGLRKELDEQMAGFPPNVVSAYAALQEEKGDISTPPGASPRPYRQTRSPTAWEPEDRRWPATTP